MLRHPKPTSVMRKGRAIEIARQGRTVVTIFAPSPETARDWRGAVAREIRESEDDFSRRWEQRCEEHARPEDYAAGLAFLRDHPEWTGSVLDLARRI